MPHSLEELLSGIMENSISFHLFQMVWKRLCVKIIKKGVKAHIGRFGLADFHWDKIGRFYVGIEISAPYGNFAEVVHPNHHSYTPSGWVKKLEKSIKSFERYCSQWSLGKFDDSYARWRERNTEETAEILAEIEGENATLRTVHS